MHHWKYSLFIILLWAISTVSAAMGNEHDLPIDFSPANPYTNPYSARSHPDKLEIYRRNTKICTIQINMSMIGQWGFIDNGNYVVVEFRDNSTRTAMALFKTTTCQLVDKITEHENPTNRPAWADIFQR